jgi:hypothetical protein
MKTAQKCKNDEFLVTRLKNVQSLMGLVNHPTTPKLWTKDHENGHKQKYDEFFGHASQTCTECHRPYKPLLNSKTMGNSS